MCFTSRVNDDVNNNRYCDNSVTYMGYKMTRLYLTLIVMILLVPLSICVWFVSSDDSMQTCQYNCKRLHTYSKGVHLVCEER